MGSGFESKDSQMPVRSKPGGCQAVEKLAAGLFLLSINP
jgi:hypothetical protein